MIAEEERVTKTGERMPREKDKKHRTDGLTCISRIIIKQSERERVRENQR